MYKKDENGKNIFLKAAEYVKTDWIKFLLEKGVYPDQIADNGMSALMLASQYGYPEIVRMLLGKGADAGLRSTENRTALDYAGDKGRTQIVNMLKDIKIPEAKIAKQTLLGDWHGSYVIHCDVYFMEINIYEQAGRFHGKGTVYTALNSKEKDSALKGKLSSAEKDFGYRFLAECDFDVYIRDYEIIIKNRTFKVLGRKNRDLWFPGSLHFEGVVYDDPTVISLRGKINSNNRRKNLISYQLVLWNPEIKLFLYIWEKRNIF